MRLRLLLVGLVTFGVSLLAIDARSTYGARVSSDEPQYLITALSLWEDFDLDVSDEIGERRYEPFHKVTINQQTIALNDSGQELSPHDPLLPLILMAANCGSHSEDTRLGVAGAASSRRLWIRTTPIR